MFSHIMLGTQNVERSKQFYDAVLGALGIGAGHIDKNRVFWRTKTGVFSTSLPIDGQAASAGNGSTIGFACSSTEQVHAWHEAGLAHGGSAIEDPPGIRQVPAGQTYLAYLRDPDGNKICALYRIPAA
ncbi:MAG: VOC family protein [Betaproteobacteria bacterium]|nr:VOC family protein [Betaproteobacteria bacterium]